MNKGKKPPTCDKMWEHWVEDICCPVCNPHWWGAYGKEIVCGTCGLVKE